MSAHSLKRFFHKLLNTDKKFRVHFPSGKLSSPMRYDSAAAYAEIFGGKIIDNF